MWIMLEGGWPEFVPAGFKVFLSPAGINTDGVEISDDKMRIGYSLIFHKRAANIRV